MRSNQIIIGFIWIFLVAQAQAQITIDQTDMPAVGDTIRLSRGINLNLDLVEETGADFIWDFSDLQAVSQQVDSVVSPLSIPIGFWFMNTANQARRLQSDISLGDFQLSNSFGFYNKTNNEYTEEGFTATISGIPIPLKYETADVLFQFPMNYGNLDSSHAFLAFGLENLAYLMIDKRRFNEMDGWGTLITPYGSFETIRIKSSVVEYDSIYIDSLGLGIPVHRLYTEYKWMGKAHKLPLLTVTKNFGQGGLLVQYIDSLRRDLIGIDEEPQMIKPALGLYPNPTSQNLSIDFDLNRDAVIYFTIYNSQGNRVFQSSPSYQYAGKVHLFYDAGTNDLPPGTYILQLIVNNNAVSNQFVLR